MSRRLGFLTGIARRRRLMIWAGIVTLAVVGAGIAGRAAWQAIELDAAEEALRRHDFPAARARLDRYLARWPRDEQALFLAARAARRADACADAERFLTTYEQNFGPTDATRFEWVLLGTQQGDFIDGEDSLHAAIDRKHADAAEALESLAKGYYIAYRWPEAVTLLDKLIERSPDHIPALLLRGLVVYRMRGTRGIEPAGVDYRRAVAQAPASAAAHTALAGWLHQLGHTREAIDHYEQALRLRSADAATLLALSRALIDTAALAEAERRLDELLAADPNHPDGLVERGRMALRRGRTAEAEGFLARADYAAPWHRDGHQYYLAALKELGRSEAAAQCEAWLAELMAADATSGRRKQGIRNAPGDLNIRWELWLWSLRNGETEESLVWLTSILRLAPRHAPSHTAFADYFDRANQPRRAAQHRAAATGS